MTIVHAQCSCGGEFERHNNIVLTSYPPKYPHQCNNCKRVVNLLSVYPQFKAQVQDIDNEYEVIDI